MSNLNMYFLMTFAFTLTLPNAVRCQESPKKTSEPKEKSVTTQRIEKHFERVSAYLGDSKKPMTMIPALFWTNRSRGQDSDGKSATVLFVQDGRPRAACCVYPPLPSDSVAHEYGSLTEKEPVRVEIDGRTRWKPKTGGVKFTTLSDSPMPSKSKTARLSQMKLLARQFDIDIFWRGVQRENLRLLAKPLYRYEVTEDAELIDGAVFCFAMGGVDPEILLLLEAVKPKGEDSAKASWRCGFARRTSAQINVAHRPPGKEKREVWSVSQLQGSGPTDTFMQTGVNNPSKN